MAECRPYPITWYSPTGIVGCEVYGIGTASWYSGDSVARNDCEYPWTSCTPIRIRSLDTGREVVVVPRMYCDCFSGTSRQRIVDLDPATLKALGLWEMRDRGLFEVVVSPASSSTPTSSSLSLPDTALPMP